MMVTECSPAESRPAWRGGAVEKQIPQRQTDGCGSSDRDNAPPDEFDITANEECRFEIFREDERRMTSTLFSGGDWHWQLVTSGGLLLAEASGYPDEQSCRVAVGILQRRAAEARVISRPSEQP